MYLNNSKGMSKLEQPDAGFTLPPLEPSPRVSAMNDGHQSQTSRRSAARLDPIDRDRSNNSRTKMSSVKESGNAFALPHDDLDH